MFVAFAREMRHVKGPLAGQPVTLEEWQIFVFGSLFGWLHDRGSRRGLRRFRSAFVQIARKNGKTLKGAMVGLFFLAYNELPADPVTGERRFDGGPEVFAAATKREQAMELFTPAQIMAEGSPYLQRRGVRHIKHKSRLVCDATGGKFVPLARDSKKEDGSNASLALIDELHAHADSGMVDVLRSSMGARPQPLVFIITTAGEDKHGYGAQTRDYYAKVVDPKSQIREDAAFVFICEPDPEDLLDYCSAEKPCKSLKNCQHLKPGWSREFVWRKANPNFGVSIIPDNFADDCSHAMQNNLAAGPFLTKQLNVWTSVATSWIKLDQWDACGRKFDVRSLEGRECYGGMDLGATQDLTAIALWFPPSAGEPATVLPFFFVPSEGMEAREKRDQVPYSRWIREGHIIATPGDTTDQEYIREFVLDLSRRFRILEFGTDPWQTRYLNGQLQTAGVSVLELPQTPATYHEACNSFESLLRGAGFRHNENPVLRWNAENSQIEWHKASGGNYRKPHKPDPKSPKRVDGLQAMMMAYSRAIVGGVGRVVSRYEEEGATFAWIDA